jgi:ABC-type multidrug transport system fused ATPase/permease subunit
MQLEAVVPFITFVAALIIFLYIRFDLSILLLVLMGAASIIHYRINKTGARMSALMESSIVPATQEKRELIQRLKGLSIHPSFVKHWIYNHFDRGATIKNLDAAERRRIATEKSKLISNILFSLAVFFVLIIIGTRAFRVNGGWTSLVVYLVALRFCFANFQNVNSKLTSINRFYPQFRRYFLFIQTIQKKSDNRDEN